MTNAVSRERNWCSWWLFLIRRILYSSLAFFIIMLSLFSQHFEFLELWKRVKARQRLFLTAYNDDQTFWNLSCLTLSVPVVLLNSLSLCPYFSSNKFERIFLLILDSLLCLINSQFLITKCHILYVLCEEKLGVNNWLGLKGLNQLSLPL